MKTINLSEVKDSNSINKFEDVAMYFSLFYTEEVEVILETFTDASDFDIIQEIVDRLGLCLRCVVETVNNQHIFCGFIWGNIL